MANYETAQLLKRGNQPPSHHQLWHKNKIIGLWANVGRGCNLQFYFCFLYCLPTSTSKCVLFKLPNKPRARQGRNRGKNFWARRNSVTEPKLKIPIILLPVIKPFRNIEFFNILRWRSLKNRRILKMTIQVLTYARHYLMWNRRSRFSNPFPINISEPRVSFDRSGTLATKSCIFINYEQLKMTKKECLCDIWLCIRNGLHFLHIY